MNLEKLHQAEASFLQRFPGGFADPGMAAIKKKHNAIAYHRTREAVAAGIVRIAWEDGRFNLADVLTKLLPGPRLKQLIGCILD